MKQSEIYKYALLAVVQKMMVDGVDDADAVYETVAPLITNIGSALFKEERDEERAREASEPAGAEVTE